MSKKIADHVKLLLRELNISEITESNIDLVIENLSLQNREYQRKPQGLLRKAVVIAMKGYFTDPKASDTSNLSSKLSPLPLERVPTSLNASLSSIYLNSTSKRTHPDIEKDDLEDTSVSTHDLDNNNTSKNENSSKSSSDKVGDIRMKKRSRADSQKEIVNSSRKSAHPSVGESSVNISAEKMSVTSYIQPRPRQRLSDLAGIDSIVNQIQELVFYPAQFRSLYAHLGVNPPSGLLLHGPSGCGKTTLAMGIAGQLGWNFLKVSGPELIGGTSGESEQRIRDLFLAATKASPSIIFIDAIDVIAGKRESSQRGMDRRVLAQLIDSIDALPHMTDKTHIDDTDPATGQTLVGDLSTNALPRLDSDGVEEESVNKLVVFIAATNRPDSLDPSIRGRFDKEIALPVPDATSRSKILRLVTASMKLAADVDFELLGKNTPGFVGADLKALVREAGMVAVRRIIREPTGLAERIPIELIGQEKAEKSVHNQESKEFQKPDNGIVKKEAEEISECIPRLHSAVSLATCSICMNDLLEGIKCVQPTAKREGFAVVPDVTWSDVGALAEVREELLTNVLEPISHPERYLKLGLEVPAGVLFFGPPGCGKTLLAKALANQSGANFISVKGPELLNMYVGESESRVRQVFARARSSAPCVIFFDELDSLCPRRSVGMDSGSGVSERVVNQMLTELDGLESRKDVYVVAATNRLELIDDAMLRPGRLGKLLYVPLPTAEDRGSILWALTRKLSTDESINLAYLESLGRDPRAEGFSGADCSALVREAGMAVVREMRTQNDQQENADSDSSSSGNSMIFPRHFEEAFLRVKPSVSLQDRKRYERVQSYIKQGKGAIEAIRATSGGSVENEAR